MRAVFTHAAAIGGGLVIGLAGTAIAGGVGASGGPTHRDMQNVVVSLRDLDAELVQYHQSVDNRLRNLCVATNVTGANCDQGG